MSNLPNRYFVDETTNLALNTENQWSHSPYLGAVKCSIHKNYSTSIHIPQEIWNKVVFSNHQKWQNAPRSIIQENLSTIKIFGFQDPRQAAWIVQELLYSGNVDTEELIEDYLELKYCSGKGELWDDLLMSVPEFEGAPLKAEDEKEYFKKFTPEVRKKIEIQRKNTAAYETSMRRKIQRQLNSMNIKVAIDDFGLEYFLMSYGSVNLKDFTKLSFKRLEI